MSMEWNPQTLRCDVRDHKWLLCHDTVTDDMVEVCQRCGETEKVFDLIDELTG